MEKVYFKILFFLTLQLAFSQKSYLDNYVYQTWNSFGGLVGTTATDIIQTNDGYLNIGTYEGLVRFDGVEFSTIRMRRGNNYKFSSVRVILEDSQGNIWLGSNDEGLHKITKDGTCVCYSMDNGLPNNSVRAICEDRAGNIWIGTAAGIVFLTPKGHLMNPQFQAGTVSKGIIATSLYCDTAGRVWLITSNEDGLFQYSDGLFHTVPQIDAYFIHKYGIEKSYFATSLIQDLNGDFWIGMADEGIFKFSNAEFKKIETNTILDYKATWTMYAMQDGTMLFGTENGVVSNHNGRFEESNNKELLSAKINKITRDREGNIWLATDRNGIGKLTHGKFLVTKLGTSSNSIAEDGDGRLWIGTDKGLLCYKGDKEIKNKITEYTKNIRIRHVGVTIRGEILVSCYSKPGQLLYNPTSEKIKNWTSEDGLAGNKVRVAIETFPDEYYIGTTTGLSIIHKNGKISTFKQVDGLGNEYIMWIMKDSNDVVWIGTDGGGIYLMKDEVIIAHITSEDGLAGNVIFKITQDNDGAYWVCTGSGISYIKPFDSTNSIPLSFENINSENGIGTNSVFQVLNDKSGNIWFTSNFGIASVKKDDLLEVANTENKAKSIQYYTKNDGLDSDGTTSTALSICDKHGRLWFTMVDGFALFDPIKVRENPVLPLVHIEEVVIDDVEYPSNLEEYVLNPGTKRIEIKFTGLSFDSPEKIQFQHQLTNFEDKLSPQSKNRIASYTNITPGKHTFLVMAINSSGLFSEEAAAILINQKPYFYQVPAFWVLVSLFVSGIFLLIFYFKQRAIKLENIRLEGMVKERTRELALEKDKSDQLLRAILPDKIADELKDNIHSVAESFDDVTLLFSDIVSFTKVSSNHSAEEIVTALNNLFTLFDIRAKAMGIEKIKTIGDAYMAACGIPTPRADHAQVMLDFAKGMYVDLETYNKSTAIKFQMRIGLNSGPVTAGVIGKTKFVYDVWGNTVNVASRMETACRPGEIRVSKSFYDHLEKTKSVFTEPIECEIKGKGKMITYELVK